MTLNLKDADIRAFIESMAELTGKNFVIDPRVQGKVTVISAMPTDPKTLYEIFVSILKVNGFSVVESGDVVKIVPDIIAKIQGGNSGPSGSFLGEEPVTRVIDLHYVTAAELVPILQPLMPAEAHIAAHNTSNAIIISDTRANVARIAQIIQRIDHRVDQDVEVIRLNQANAAELAKVVNAIRPQTADTATGQAPTPVVADLRTNSLLIGGNRETRLRLRSLIYHLDTPIDLQSGVEVIYLRNASAVDIVETLREVGKKLEAQAAQGAAAEAGAPGTAEEQADARKLDVFADEATNALILQGPPARLKELRSVIQALDIRRAQVYVDGIIAEVSATKAAELGISWRTSTPEDGFFGSGIFPGTEAGDLQDLARPFTFGTGLTLGFLEGGDIRVLLRALASDGLTNVLATPTLVTMDNEEAEIVVGQNVPFITGQFSSTGTGQGVTNPFQTIERQDVGVKLRVKPQINEGDAVRLTIEQEVSSIAPSTTTSTADIVTNKRSIRTNVLVEDSQIIVIGGLISDDVRQSTQKVPLLGDIPLIGNAFRNRRSDTVRTNLMVFLRPTILRDKLTAANITMSKYSYIRDLQNLAPQDRVQLLPQEPTPKLPPAPTAPLPQGELPPPVEKLHGTGANMPPPESTPKAPDSGTSSTSSLSPGSPKAFVTAGSGKAPNPTPADSRSLASTPAPTQSTVSRQRMEPALRPRILDAAR